MGGKNLHLGMRNLKQTELQKLEEGKVEDKTRTYENTKPQETTPGHSSEVTTMGWRETKTGEGGR